MDNYVYHDRKMMKWIPFNALLEQSDYLNNLFDKQNRKEAPTLLPDQIEDLNYKLETAYHFRNAVVVTYFQAYKYHTVEGYITSADYLEKTITIDETTLYSDTIVDITIL